MSEPDSTPRQAKPYHHGDLKRTLILEALRFIQGSCHSTPTIRQIAGAAGVSHAAAYRHFPGKEALLAAVAEEGFRMLGKALQAAEQDQGKFPLAILLDKGLAYVGFARSHPGHFRVMFGPEAVANQDFPSLLEASTVTYQSLRATVVQCQAAGLMKSDSPDVIALVAWSAVHGLAALFLDGQLPGPVQVEPFDPTEMTKTVCQQALRGFINIGGWHE
jgi:AcrR family transcriptional regulator